MKKAIIRILASFLMVLGLAENLLAQEIIFTETCPISGEVKGQNESAAVILGLLAQAVIPIAIDWGAATLAAQGQPETKSWNLKGSSYLYQLSSTKGEVSTDRYSDFRCLVIAIPDKTAKKTDKPSDTRFTDLYKKNIKDNSTYNNQLPIDPLIYIELAVKKSDDNRFFKLDPRLLFYKKATTSSWTTKPRDLSLTLNFNQPGESTPFASTVIAFDRLSEQEFRNYKEERTDDSNFGSNASEWLPLPALDEADQKKITGYKVKLQESQAYDAQVAIRKKQIEQLEKLIDAPYEVVDPKITAAIKKYCDQLRITKEHSDDCPATKYLAKKNASQAHNKLEALTTINSLKGQTPGTEILPPPDLNTSVAPFNLFLVVTETRDANAFLKHLAEALNNSKEGISKELVSSVVPSERKAAKEKETEDKLAKAANQDTAAVNALSANKSVLDAQIALDDAANLGASPLVLQKLKNDLLIAKINANKAYRAAGLETVEYSIPAIP